MSCRPILFLGMEEREITYTIACSFCWQERCPFQRPCRHLIFYQSVYIFPRKSLVLV